MRPIVNNFFIFLGMDKLKLKLSSLKREDQDKYYLEASKGKKKISAVLDNEDVRSIISFFDNKIK